jgi:hypothetical protein
MKRFAASSLAVSLATGLCMLLGLVEGCGRSSLTEQFPYDGTDASTDGTFDGPLDGSEGGPDGSRGCKNNKDCASTPSTPYCEIPPGKCVQCEVPSQCPAGDTCQDHQCVPLCTGGSCAGGLTCCGPVCVNEQTDPDNCDGCGHACAPGESCIAGECQVPPSCHGGPPCGPEDQCCTKGCANLDSDPQNCGTCDHPCTGAQTCIGGMCISPVSCNGGPACTPPDQCCSTGCTDTSSDPSNCAKCGHACGPGESCVESMCQGGPSCNGEPACTGGQTCCSDGCTNTATDPQNCKSCGNACPMGDTCVASSCIAPPDCNGGPACTMGETCCKSGCTDTSSDPNNCSKCGLSCGPDSTCVAGVCQSPFTCNGGPPCSPLDQCCATGCVDTTSDPNNCKNCGTVCPLGDSCIDSVCTPATTCNGGTACTPGFSCCPSPTGCVNEGSDPNNCGGCGIPCGPPNTCAGGFCVANEGGFNPIENPCVLTPGVHTYTTIDIPAGVTCYVEGGGSASGTLQMIAAGAVVIDGAIDLSGGYGRQDEISSETTETGWAGNGGYTGCPEDLDPVGPPVAACGFASGSGGTWGFTGEGTVGGCTVFTGCDFISESGDDCTGDPGICPLIFAAPPAQYGGGSGIFTGFRAYGGGGGGPAGGAPGALGAPYPGEEDCSGAAGSGGATAGQGGLGGGAPYDGQVGVTGQTQCAGVMAGVPPAYVGGGGGGSIGPFASADLAVATTFQTGSGGGGGSGDYLNRPEFGGTSGGGGGGGALMISSPVSITISGQVLANGGPGGDAYIGTGLVTGCNPQPGAGGGGGSGGVIFLSSPNITVAAGATVSTAGGAGGAQSEFATGGGGGPGGLGRIRLSVTPSTCTLSGSFNPPLSSACSAASKSGATYVGVYPN